MRGVSGTVIHRRTGPRDGEIDFRAAPARKTGGDLVRQVHGWLRRAQTSDWSPRQDLLVIEGFAQGLGADGVARRMRRSRAAVVARFRRLLPDPTPDTQRIAMEALRAAIRATA